MDTSLCNLWSVSAACRSIRLNTAELSVAAGSGRGIERGSRETLGGTNQEEKTSWKGVSLNSPSPQLRTEGGTAPEASQRRIIIAKKRFFKRMSSGPAPSLLSGRSRHSESQNRRSSSGDRLLGGYSSRFRSFYKHESFIPRSSRIR